MDGKCFFEFLIEFVGEEEWQDKGLAFAPEVYRTDQYLMAVTSLFKNNV